MNGLKANGKRLVRDGIIIHGDLDRDIKMEPFFQMQFNYDSNRISASELLDGYDRIVKNISKHNIVLIDQLSNDR